MNMALFRGRILPNLRGVTLSNSVLSVAYERTAATVEGFARRCERHSGPMAT